MFCSTIIPTVARSTLTNTVESVLQQQFSEDDFEIIVVNDSGKPLSKMNWQESPKVHIINTCKRERSVARNAGAAIAKGKYLHFLDDDDCLWPDAYQAFWQLAQTTNAAWLYGGTQLVDRNDTPIIPLLYTLEGNCLIQMIAGEWLPLQSSFIKAEAFFAVGGFNPFINASEDVDLARRIAIEGDIAGTKTIVASVGVGEESSTTDYKRLSQQSRWAREKILAYPKVFTRMQQSAKNSDYWHGRIIRAYLTSCIWNIQHKHLFTAWSRFLFGFVSFLYAIPHLLSANFWQAVTKEHEGQAFRKGTQLIKKGAEIYEL